jgi:GntR family transcriptional repressor for pyruvate dehydrogenase complex
VTPSPRAQTAVANGSTGATRRLADIVHEQLFRLIARGEFPKGCKLPPEGELATRFGVSRPVIRDALAKLKEQGYVRSQRGSGSIVTRGEAPGTHAYPAIRTVSDLLRSYEFRITVECATAAMAAERRDAIDIADIARTLERAESSIDRGVLHLLGGPQLRLPSRGSARHAQSVLSEDR